MYAQKLSFDYAHTLHTVRIVHNAHSVHRSRIEKGQSCDCINFVRATDPCCGSGGMFVQSEKFVNAQYQNNLLTTAEVIDELIKIAQDLKKADMRSSEMGLSSDELAFYDALSLNDSATEVLGDEQLRIIAREVADKVRKNATIDWAVKESVRARLMVIVRRILKKYGYPPDKQEQAIQMVMTQAANLADDWAQE